jgi:acylphosphatase
VAPSPEPDPSLPFHTVRLIILGRVQGVGYRMWAVETANRFGISGWVRNLTDGSVEVLAHAGDEAVNAFAAACRVGPSWGQVRAVNVKPEAVSFKGAGFEQRATSSPAG